MTAWRPRDSFGSATVTVSNASASSPSTWSPRLSESTANVTVEVAVSAVPKARRPISGRSETRYSGAIVASAKKGRPTGIEQRSLARRQAGPDGRGADMPRREVVGEVHRHAGLPVRACVHASEQDLVAEVDAVVAAPAGRVATAAVGVRPRCPMRPVGHADARSDPDVDLVERVRGCRPAEGEQLLVDRTQDDRGRHRVTAAVAGGDLELDVVAGHVPGRVRRDVDREASLVGLERGTERRGPGVSGSVEADRSDLQGRRAPTASNVDR